MENLYAWNPAPKKRVLKQDQVIIFKTSSKYEQDFLRGERGIIDRVISPFPSATDTIYEVTHEFSGKKVWVTGNDIEPHDQLMIPIIDESPAAKEDTSSTEVQRYSYIEDGDEYDVTVYSKKELVPYNRCTNKLKTVQCNRELNHPGKCGNDYMSWNSSLSTEK